MTKCQCFESCRKVFFNWGKPETFPSWLGEQDRKCPSYMENRKQMSFMIKKCKDVYFGKWEIWETCLSCSEVRYQSLSKRSIFVTSRSRTQELSDIEKFRQHLLIQSWFVSRRFIYITGYTEWNGIFVGEAGKMYTHATVGYSASSHLFMRMGWLKLRKTYSSVSCLWTYIQAPDLENTIPRFFSSAIWFSLRHTTANHSIRVGTADSLQPTSHSRQPTAFRCSRRDVCILSSSALPHFTAAPLQDRPETPHSAVRYTQRLSWFRLCAMWPDRTRLLQSAHTNHTSLGVLPTCFHQSFPGNEVWVEKWTNE